MLQLRYSISVLLWQQTESHFRKILCSWSFSFCMWRPLWPPLNPEFIARVGDLCSLCLLIHYLVILMRAVSARLPLLFLYSDMNNAVGSSEPVVHISYDKTRGGAQVSHTDRWHLHSDLWVREPLLTWALLWKQLGQQTNIFLSKGTKAWVERKMLIKYVEEKNRELMR